jgi:hypothetical protein
LLLHSCEASIRPINFSVISVTSFPCLHSNFQIWQTFGIGFGRRLNRLAKPGFPNLVYRGLGILLAKGLMHLIGWLQYRGDIVTGIDDLAAGAGSLAAGGSGQGAWVSFAIEQGLVDGGIPEAASFGTIRRSRGSDSELPLLSGLIPAIVTGFIALNKQDCVAVSECKYYSPGSPSVPAMRRALTQTLVSIIALSTGSPCSRRCSVTRRRFLLQ